MPFTKQFKRFRSRVWESNIGNPVPTSLKKEFGTKFNKKDILPLAKKKAKIQGIQVYKFNKWNKEVIK